MKQNSRSIVGEVAKPSGVGLDELNRAIEPFRAGVADSVLTVVEQTCLMSPEHPDNFLDRLQTTAHRVVRPCVEETLGRPGVAIAPEFLAESAKPALAQPNFRFDFSSPTGC